MNPDDTTTNQVDIENPALGEGLNALLDSGGAAFFETFIPKMVGLLFVFGSISFFFMFVWGAISWILSGGDKGAIEAAKARIVNAVIGFVLMIGVFAVVALIEVFFGINILTIDIGPLVIQ